MFDFFNRRKLREAREDNRILRGRLALTEVQLSIEKTIIRTMDQLIYNMAQQTEWPMMRNDFAKLLRGTEQRRKDESDRIATNIINELSRS